MNPWPEWLSTTDAAYYLGITSKTLRRLIDSGELPAYRIGRVLRLKQSEVDEFIAGARIVPQEPVRLRTVRDVS